MGTPVDFRPVKRASQALCLVRHLAAEALAACEGACGRPCWGALLKHPRETRGKVSALDPMLLPVHDSVLLELPEGLVEETRRIVVEAMESVPAGFAVPLRVEVKAGKSWAECKLGRGRRRS
jgi:hypothetical protein